MDVFRDTLRIPSRTADASIAAAGTVGGATVNGVVSGVQGVVGGVRSGVSSGSRSTAAALTLAALGAAGLVEWPVLLPVGRRKSRDCKRRTSEITSDTPFG